MGLIQYYAFGYAPRNTMPCAGALLPINQNQALFSLLGTTYGGNGINTFALPDLRGRSIYSTGQAVGSGPAYSLGQMGGHETATIPANSLPSHTHTVTGPAINASTEDGDQESPDRNYAAVPSTRANMFGPTAGTNSLGGAQFVVGAAGANIPFNLLAPYLALNCCIVTAGIYPSRN